jgi:hypothetical protein
MLEVMQEIERLFQNQVEAWPRLARGVEGLAQAQTRAVRIDWFEVLIRHIPHRAVSTTAAVDPQSIAKRPCFLCSENMDPEQKGIAYNSDYMVYCNPFPIVDRHLTIIHRNHGLQRIEGEFGSLLEIAKALPGYFVLYNGPECGASAPDHLHFQAGLRAPLPIVKETAGFAELGVRNYARNVFLFRASERSRLADKLDGTVEILAEVAGKKPEPLLNVAAFYDKDEWTVFLFPRIKHRPAVYHTGERTISPGTIDLCGIIVAPFEKDYVGVSGTEIAAIYREVTLPDDMFEEVKSRL